MDAEGAATVAAQALEVPEGLGVFEHAEGERLVRDGQVLGIVGGNLKEDAAVRAALVKLAGRMQEARASLARSGSMTSGTLQKPRSSTSRMIASTLCMAGFRLVLCGFPRLSRSAQTREGGDACEGSESYGRPREIVKGTRHCKADDPPLAPDCVESSMTEDSLDSSCPSQRAHLRSEPLCTQSSCR